MKEILKANWDSENYQRFISELKKEQDLKYREFHLGILGVDKNIIGIRTPRLKEIARKISKGDWRGFVSIAGRELYEESVLKGLVIGYVDMSFRERIEYIEEFIRDIDNWAVCDICVGNFKFIKKNLEVFYPFVKQCIYSHETWKIRVGLVILLDYYMNEEYCEDIFALCTDVKKDSYYVKMAQAWLISILFINFRERTLRFLEENDLDSWIQNKAIQKIRESTRVSVEDKHLVLNMKK